MLLKRTIFTFSSLLFTLTFNGCLAKQSDGKYHSQYSYHPYFKMYNSKIIVSSSKSYNPSTLQNYSKERVQNDRYATQQTNDKQYARDYKHAVKKTFKRVIKRITHNDEDNYPSNVPAGGY